jgi:hypothetical protein
MQTFFGVLPEAMARAIERGRAIIATTIPAVISLIICSRVNVCRARTTLV